METTRKTSSTVFEAFHVVPDNFTGSFIIPGDEDYDGEDYIYNVYVNGEPHSTTEPSYIWYTKTGQAREEWYYNGHMHRFDGPAVTDTRERYGNEYWIHGASYQKEEAYWNHPIIVWHNILRKADRIIDEIF